MARLKFWVWLSCVDGVRPLIKYNLVMALGGPEQVSYASRQEMEACGGVQLRKAEIEHLCDKSTDMTARVLGKCSEKNISILTLQDADYPERLRQIADPPVALYIIGRLPEVDERPLIAVVGTRKATPYGLRMAEKLGQELTAGGGVVVSGMAAGCDGAAIQGALQAGGTPVGVLGTAIDQVYPKTNKNLFDEVRFRGALVSEYAPGMRTYAANFVARNRIITGLSLGVVVVEAPVRRGTRTTVEHALDQNRDLFAVPENADTRMDGCNDLLAQGAMVATCGDDVLQVYTGRQELVFQADNTPSVIPMVPTQYKKEIDKPENIVYIDHTDNDSNNNNKGGKTEPQPVYDTLPPEAENLPTAQRDILSAIVRPDMHADEIIQATSLPTAEALAALTMLEITGYIVRSTGKRYSRKGK